MMMSAIRPVVVVVARPSVGVAVWIDDDRRRRRRIVGDRGRSIDHRWGSVDDGRRRRVHHRRLCDDHGRGGSNAAEP